ncbi:DUF4489 domain-containing protein [Clostridium algoriphilum]|uniref:DUF4489 domain-containing protein n=1 Tax=Clostridium algoriphilum TaxID=198347 RepID=UPI001CF16F76|nr:DUF4489 domain-containing protein [Clostridium algoriphilum]MCB2292212.1 DUF4489 domain-containing protein [Clostridium algoriphilum]
MNSMSKGNWQDEKDCGCKKEKEDCRKKEKEDEVLLKCKTGFPVTIPFSLTTPTSFTLNTLTLKIERFCNPCIKFEFASNIVTTDAEVTLEFQILKQCRRQTTPTAIGPVWIFSRTPIAIDPALPVGNTGADAFTFIVCDCDCEDDSCFDECCTYTVVVTATETGAAGTTVINNPTFSALVVENKCHCS